MHAEYTCRYYRKIELCNDDIALLCQIVQERKMVDSFYLSTTDCEFMQTPPSVIACSAIGSAMKNGKVCSADILYNLHLITGIDMVRQTAICSQH